MSTDLMKITSLWQRTGHRLPKKGWLKPRHQFLKNPNKIKPHFFHAYFQSVFPSHESSKYFEFCNVWLLELCCWGTGEDYGWPIHSQYGENITFNLMTCPALISLLFPHHNKPTLSSLCSGLTAPFWPQFCCSFSSQKVDEKMIWSTRGQCVLMDLPEAVGAVWPPWSLSRADMSQVEWGWALSAPFCCLLLNLPWNF